MINSTFLVARDFYIPVNIFELYSRMRLSCLDTVSSFQILLLNFF